MSTNKYSAKNHILRSLLNQVIQRYRQSQEFDEWLRAGQPLPPPQLVKQRIVRAFAQQFRLRVFIETGTYLGDMIAAVQGIFREVYSIELGRELYENAKRRFAGKHHIVILHGDSASLLPSVLARVNSPCLFWLDAHWSAGNTARGVSNTPIRQELHHILNHHVKGHVILVDDAHSFTGQDDYPALQEMRDLVEGAGTYDFWVRNDITAIAKSGIGREPAVSNKPLDFVLFDALNIGYHATPLPSMIIRAVRQHFAEAKRQHLG